MISLFYVHSLVLSYDDLDISFFRLNGPTAWKIEW